MRRKAADGHAGGNIVRASLAAVLAPALCVAMYSPGILLIRSEILRVVRADAERRYRRRNGGRSRGLQSSAIGRPS